MRSDAENQPGSESDPAAEAAAAGAPSVPSDAGVDPAASDAEDPGAGAAGFPDPSTLLAMAAMHLETGVLLKALVSVFDSHAWRSMGLVADHTGEVRQDLPAAQTAIDCLAFVLGKIEPALTESDRRDAQRRLMDLRMNYVAKAREAGV